MILFMQRVAEFVFVYFYQSILFVYGIHFFSKHPIKWKPYFLCAVISMIATYFARIALTFGNHTIFSLIILILLSIILLKIPAQAVVKSALIITILMYLFEGTLWISFKTIYSAAEFEDFLNSETSKIVSGILSNVMLTILLFVLYMFRKKKARRKQMKYKVN